MPFGPQAGSGFMSPTPQQPMGMDPNAEWSMQNDARQQALMHGMRGMLNNQYQGNMQGAGMLGARVANQGLGNPLGQALAPVGNAVRSGMSSLKGLAGMGAQQSYNVGGQTTLGATSASSAGLTGTAAPAYATAGEGVLDSSAPSLLGSASSGLSLVGAAYGAYAGLNGAQESARKIHEAISYGVSPEDEAKMRQSSFNNGMVSSGIGSGAGLIGGGLPGMLLGGAGGLSQAWQSEDSNPDRARALGSFVSNPFKR